MRPIIFVFSLIVMSSRLASAETIQIDFTSDDSYSVEVAKIDVGDTIDWLPRMRGITLSFWEVLILILCQKSQI